MKKIMQFNQTHADLLIEFLDAAERSEGTMSYWESVGFLFVIACSPELIKPSEWLPVIFDSDSTNEPILDSSQEVLSALMALYNELNRQVQESDVNLLPGCEIREVPMANMEENAPISQWSRGFIDGYGWLEDLWAEYVPDKLSEDIGLQMLVLSFFSTREIADAFLDDAKEEVTMEIMAENMRSLFVDAMQSFGLLGLSIQQAILDHHATGSQPILSMKTGRNEPCPCGSGKKFKKCCINADNMN